jgi:hypothetical protein
MEGDIEEDDDEDDDDDEDESNETARFLELLLLSSASDSFAFFFSSFPLPSSALEDLRLPSRGLNVPSCLEITSDFSSANDTRCVIKSNQIKSNQIKSNQIKSNQIHQASEINDGK